MSQKDSATRRKILAAMGGAGSTALGVPAVAADPTETSGDAGDGTAELTEEKLRRELAQSPMAVGPNTGDPEVVPTSSQRVRDFTSTNDVQVYVGQYKNAETPTGKPFAVESFEEYMNREAPPGFETPDGGSTVGTDAVVSTDSGFDTYYKEDIGSVELAGYELSLGVGVGVKMVTSGTSVYAELTFDLYINNFSVSLFTQSVGVGVNKDGLCFDRLSIDYSYVPELSVDGCFEASVTKSGGDYVVGVGVSIDACADPCSKFWDCELCHGVGGEFSFEV